VADGINVFVDVDDGPEKCVVCPPSADVEQTFKALTVII